LNNRLKITKTGDFVKKSSFFERLVSQALLGSHAKLGKEPTGFLNKSNVSTLWTDCGYKF
jgi:hypothetical protein